MTREQMIDMAVRSVVHPSLMPMMRGNSEIADVTIAATAHANKWAIRAEFRRRIGLEQTKSRPVYSYWSPITDGFGNII